MVPISKWCQDKGRTWLDLNDRGDTGGMVIADNQNVEIDKITTNKKYEPVYWCKVIFNETCRFVDTCSKYMSELFYKP